MFGFERERWKVSKEGPTKHLSLVNASCGREQTMLSLQSKAGIGNSMTLLTFIARHLLSSFLQRIEFIAHRDSFTIHVTSIVSGTLEKYWRAERNNVPLTGCQFTIDHATRVNCFESLRSFLNVYLNNCKGTAVILLTLSRCLTQLRAMAQDQDPFLRNNSGGWCIHAQMRTT